MKYISIKQPWAWLIVSGQKDIENRDWPTRFRGQIALHAGKHVPAEIDLLLIEARFGVKIPREELKFGGVVGVAEISDCVRHHDSQWFSGEYGFVIKNARPVTFVPWKGNTGIQNLPFDPRLMFGVFFQFPRRYRKFAGERVQFPEIRFKLRKRVFDFVCLHNFNGARTRPV